MRCPLLPEDALGPEQGDCGAGNPTASLRSRGAPGASYWASSPEVNNVVMVSFGGLGLSLDDAKFITMVRALFHRGERRRAHTSKRQTE